MLIGAGSANALVAVCPVPRSTSGEGVGAAVRTAVGAVVGAIVDSAVAAVAALSVDADVEMAGAIDTVGAAVLEGRVTAT